MINGGLTFLTLSKPNFILAFDDMGYKNPVILSFEFTVKKTIVAKMKYWLFCKFFPFKIKKWDP